MMERSINYLMGLGGIGHRVEGVLIGSAIGNLGISHVSGLVGIVGDFSLINPYGVRVKGFL